MVRPAWIACLHGRGDNLVSVIYTWVAELRSRLAKRRLRGVVLFLENDLLIQVIGECYEF